MIAHLICVSCFVCILLDIPNFIHAVGMYKNVKYKEGDSWTKYYCICMCE